MRNSRFDKLFCKLQKVSTVKEINFISKEKKPKYFLSKTYLNHNRESKKEDI